MPRFTVLVVDDEKTLARSIKLFLDAHGYEAEVAEDGDAALELLEKLHPDLVFLDLRLPKTTDLELLKKIREYDPHIAVVLLTAYGTIEGARSTSRNSGSWPTGRRRPRDSARR